MTKPRIMPVFVGEALSDAWMTLLKPDEFGAYWRLAFHAWLENGLPNDDLALRRLVGASGHNWPRIWSVLECKFPLGSNGKRIIIKQESIRDRVNSRIEKAANAAKLRWDNERRALRTQWNKNKNKNKNKEEDPVADATGGSGFSIPRVIDSMRRTSRITLPPVLEDRHGKMIKAIIDKCINAKRTPDDLDCVMDWLEAGALSYRDMITLETLVKSCGEFLTASGKWRSNGRPPIGDASKAPQESFADRERRLMAERQALRPALQPVQRDLELEAEQRAAEAERVLLRAARATRSDA